MFKKIIKIILDVLVVIFVLIIILGISRYVSRIIDIYHEINPDNWLLLTPLILEFLLIIFIGVVAFFKKTNIYYTIGVFSIYSLISGIMLFPYIFPNVFPDTIIILPITSGLIIFFISLLATVSTFYLIIKRKIYTDKKVSLIANVFKYIILIGMVFFLFRSIMVVRESIISQFEYKLCVEEAIQQAKIELQGENLLGSSLYGDINNDFLGCHYLYNKHAWYLFVYPNYVFGSDDPSLRPGI